MVDVLAVDDPVAEFDEDEDEDEEEDDDEEPPEHSD